MHNKKQLINHNNKYHLAKDCFLLIRMREIKPKGNLHRISKLHLVILNLKKLVYNEDIFYHSLHWYIMALV